MSPPNEDMQQQSPPIKRQIYQVHHMHEASLRPSMWVLR